MSEAYRQEDTPTGKITLTNTGETPLWARGVGDICCLMPGEATDFLIDKSGAVSVGRAYRGVVAGAGPADEWEKMAAKTLPKEDETPTGDPT